MVLRVVLIILSYVAGTNALYQIEKPSKEECSCFCPEPLSDDVAVCQKLSRFEKELSSVKDAIEHRTRYINELKELQEKLEWQEYYVDTLSNEIESLKSLVGNKPQIPTPQPLIMNPEDQMQNDGRGGSARLVNGNGELLKNVSDLIAKVEVVENLTMEVQEELKSERRVRRHLEEDINETRSSVQVLGDKLQNITEPVDTRISHVEEVVITTLENLNKTIFNDHLQKLYYKVDGVAYQNETRKLDERMGNIETELVNESNTSTVLFEELKNLTEALSNLNVTLMEKITADEIRLEEIEKKAGKLNIVEILDAEIDALVNTSTLIQSGVNDLWADIQDVKNFAIKSQHEFEWRMSFIENSTTLVEQEQIPQLIEEITFFKLNMSKTLESMQNIRKEVDVLTAFEIANENKVNNLKVELNTSLKEIRSKLSNISETCSLTLNSTHQELEKYQKMFDKESEELEELVEISQDSGLNQIHLSNYSYDFDDEVTIFGNKVKTDKKSCLLPENDDDHLRYIEEKNDNGQQLLVFYCLPIGQYALQDSETTLWCDDGKWIGVYPKCIKLRTEQEVFTLSKELAMKSPCLTAQLTRKFPDSTDCSRYFSCFNGKTDRLRCPRNQQFSPVEKKCVPADISMCKPYDTRETELLKDLIPTILIEPNNVDKANGLMGTGNYGQLIVYPRTNFKLHCLYPKNMWGDPEWWYSSLNTSSFTTLISQASGNFITTTVNAPGHDNSGTYTCRTPFGRRHSITIVIETVTCPVFELSPTDHYEVYYPPHPEVQPRVMTTKAVFSCRGKKISHATCLANGTWSRGSPTENECPPPNSNSIFWGCPPIDTKKEPDLVLETFDGNQTVAFKCTGRTRLIGSAQTRCDTENNEWTHSRLPRCIPVT